jgi:hypothetical protein
MKLLSLKIVMAPIIHKIHVFFSKCDNVIENIQKHFIFIFLGLKFCMNVKNNYKKKIFNHFSFLKNLRKKSLDFQKNENDAVTFFLLVLVWYFKK